MSPERGCSLPSCWRPTLPEAQAGQLVQRLDQGAGETHARLPGVHSQPSTA